MNPGTVVNEKLDHWRALWDDAYEQPVSEGDPSLNLAGWTSSYTGLPIPAAEMREWVGGTVGRILSLAPTRVLEIGCGTGMLLLRIAPRCASYYGVDFSSSALAYVDQQVRAAGVEGVKLCEGQADALPLAATDRFDLVVLNSVVQYFPDADYLQRVLDSAVEHVAPGGTLFLGDLRSRSLLPCFHSSVLLRQADSDRPLAELASEVERNVATEMELTFDPTDIEAIAVELPCLASVKTQLKRGRRHNELTCFRYDAAIRLEDDPCRPLAAEDDRKEVDWRDEALSASALRRWLGGKPGVHLTLHSIPNARLVKEVEALRLLRRREDIETAGQLATALRQARLRGIEPEDLWRLESGDDEGERVVEVDWQAGSADRYVARVGSRSCRLSCCTPQVELVGHR